MAKQGGSVETPRRICVIGCPGTGKSTLARELGAGLGLPVFHLDRISWRAGWVMAESEEFDRDLRKIVAQDRWIIDGNYSRTMPVRFPRAQAIVWLDLPTRAALWGVVRRFAHYRSRGVSVSRPDLPAGCPEKWDWQFIKFVLGFRARQRNAEHIREHGSHARLIHVKRRREIAGVAAALAAAGSQHAL
jgi:adenylate kinase family enzyme